MHKKINKLQSNELLKLDLDCIYPVSDMLKAIGASRGSIDKLKRQGLEVRWFGGRQWAKAADVWKIMRPATKKNEELASLEN